MRLHEGLSGEETQGGTGCAWNQRVAVALVGGCDASLVTGPAFLLSSDMEMKPFAVPAQKKRSKEHPNPSHSPWP